MQKNIIVLGFAIVLLGVAFYVSTLKHDNADKPKPTFIVDTASTIIVPPPTIAIEISIPATSFDNAIEMAKKSNRQILLVFGADWCKWCKKLDNETLPDPSVVEALKGYIVYHVNVDKEPKIARQFKQSGGIPSYSIIDSDSKVIKQGSGYKTPQEFKDWLNNYLMKRRFRFRTLRYSEYYYR